jgi:hypothetical protein
VQGQAFCGGAAKFYNESIDPVLSQVYELVGPDSDRTHRARTTAARAMAHMGQCWANCGRLQVAEQTLDAAAQLGQGPPVESSIRGVLQQVRDALNRQRVASSTTYAPPLTAMHGTQTQLAPKARPYKPVYNTTGGSGGWGGRSIIIVVVVVAIRGLASLSSLGSNSTAPSYNSPYRPTPTYTTPSYAPPSPPNYSNPPPVQWTPDRRPVFPDPPVRNPQPFRNPNPPAPYVPAMPGPHHR